MKKIYSFISVSCFLLLYHISIAQCSVSVSGSPNTTQLDCKIKSITLTAKAVASGSIKYTWTKINSGIIGTAQKITITDSGTYQVTIVSSTCSAVSSPVHITKAGIGILAFPGEVCSGSPSALVAVGGSNYHWQPGLQTTDSIVVTPKDTTIYMVTGTTANGCTYTGSYKLIVHPLPDASISAANSTSCQYDIVTQPKITFRGLKGKPPYTFAYTFNGGSNALTITTAGSSTSAVITAPTGQSGTFTYNLTSVTDGNGCRQALSKTPLVITVLPAPFFTSAITGSTCSGSPYTYTAISSAPNTIFSWKRVAVLHITNKADSAQSDSIHETLISDTSQPVVVSYIFTLSVNNNCSRKDTVQVTVNPVPKVDTITPKAYCNSFNAPPITFTSTTPGVSFAWRSDKDVGFGFGATNTTSIPAFTAKNPKTGTVIATVTVTPSVAGSSCPGQTRTFSVTVYPTPKINTIGTYTYCNEDSVRNGIRFSSSTQIARFTWTADTSVGFGLSGKDSIRSFTAKNPDTIPLVAHVTLSVTAGLNTCQGADSIFPVRVNPTPKIKTILFQNAYCNGDDVRDGIRFSSSTPNANFIWTSSTDIGFKTSNTGNIPAFKATNPGTAPIVATVIVSATADGCRGADSTFTITVNPSPQKPGFTSFAGADNTNSLQLCRSSQNINFNVISPQPDSSGITYTWTSEPPDSVDIKDSVHPNTAITFNGSGAFTIKVTASGKTGSCSIADSQMVQVRKDTIGIDKNKVFEKQLGNLLIYPDNSLTHYQWGYDTAVSLLPDTVTSKPIPVQGQTYQFYIPDSASCHCIKNNDSLNVDRFFYWVMLTKNGCDTKIYFNGPYDDKPDEVRLPDPINTIQLQVMPNPNKGAFKIDLRGNIYGNIEAQVYSSASQLVYRKQFVKTSADIAETIVTSGLSTGVYFLILRSSDLKEVRSRFVISQ